MCDVEDVDRTKYSSVLQNMLDIASPEQTVSESAAAFHMLV